MTKMDALMTSKKGKKRKKRGKKGKQGPTAPDASALTPGGKKPMISTKRAY